MKNLKSIYFLANESFKINLFKSLFAFLLASLITGIANFVCSFVIILTSKTLILPFVALLALLVVNTCLTFGLQLLIYLLYKKENAILGHLFYFFKDVKRIFLVTLFQIASYFVLIFLAFIPYLFLGNAEQDFSFLQAFLEFTLLEPNSPEFILAEEILAKGLSFGFLLSTIICVILVLLFHLITSFIPFKMYENPNFSVFRIIKDSVKSCIKSIFEFIFVCFMTCRWILLILIGAIILVFVLKISIISSLLSFVLGLLLVSAFFAISAFYCYKCFVPKTETSNIILLPENFEAEIIESEISEENPEEEILSNENSEEDNATEIQESEGE
jgi:hypothetical protein